MAIAVHQAQKALVERFAATNFMRLPASKKANRRLAACSTNPTIYVDDDC